MKYLKIFLKSQNSTKVALSFALLMAMSSITCSWLIIKLTAGKQGSVHVCFDLYVYAMICYEVIDRSNKL